MRMQQSSSLHSGQLSKYSAGPLTENLSGLQQITISSRRETLRDPLGVAERGKVGLPPSSSECSSNSSADASIESNMGIINGERKGKIFEPMVKANVARCKYFKSCFLFLFSYLQIVV